MAFGSAFQKAFSDRFWLKMFKELKDKYQADLRRIADQNQILGRCLRVAVNANTGETVRFSNQLLWDRHPIGFSVEIMLDPIARETQIRFHTNPDER